MLTPESRSEFESALKLSGYSGRISFGEHLAPLTSIRIGGPADIIVRPKSTNDLNNAICVLNESKIRFDILGGGSNVLFPDEGYPGAIIKIGVGMSGFEIQDYHLKVGAGLQLGYLMKRAVNEGYGGLDFLVGIPGTIGGALALNAGTADEWIDSVLLWVESVNPDGELTRTDKPKGGYRKGLLAGQECIFVSAGIKRIDTDPADVQESMKKRMMSRVESQPYGYRSAGSIFKNPEGHKAWQLIESVGLRGKRSGGASFSEKHSNFIVCDEGTSSADVRYLIGMAKDRISEQYGINMEPEIVMLGFEN